MFLFEIITGLAFGLDFLFKEEEDDFGMAVLHLGIFRVAYIW